MRVRLGIGLTLALFCLASFQAPASAQTDNTASLWDDFNHYVLIARPDLALGIGQKLLQVDEGNLLDVVEASSYIDYDRTLYRASRVDTLTELATQLKQKIQKARIARSRDTARILADIRSLAEGARANLNATQRLRAAGEYATPALLDALQDDSLKPLHPFVLAAMAAIGRPVVYPLSVALPRLEPVQQGQVAQVLAEIGYPRALPYMREVLENPTADATAKSIVESAYLALARSAGVPGNVSAAELYMTLGQNHYESAARGDALPGYDPTDDIGLIWQFSRERKLTYTPVPGAIFGYVLAMKSAHRAMELNPHLAPALSLWLAANLTRENRLPADKKDLSYPKDWRPAADYLQMAGPLRQHDVLHRALSDHDSALALDAIAALRQTAGTDALINREGTIQPLLACLNYPDRRVRYHAAFTMANARPRSDYPGSHRVVPVLSEAIRQSDRQYGFAIARDIETAKALAGILREGLGMQAVGVTSYDQMIEALRGKPGVDLIVCDLDVDATSAMYKQRVDDYRVVAAPLIAMAANSADLASFNAMFESDPGVFPITRAANLDGIKPAVELATQRYAGSPITEEEANSLAMEALGLLHDIAQIDSGIYHAADAEPALTEALGDSRGDIAIAASRILAMLDSTEAQRHIADAVMAATEPEMRVALLNSLADSATQIGNRLTEPQIDKLLDLVKTSTGDLAQAAARAHGALTLPASDVVELIATPKK
ncbi:MAG: hypothetical protein IT440_14050 [Phycisphaeraceae bacterium]|nr:hypothetical protein [Phycisphaeraceae bacterium]